MTVNEVFDSAGGNLRAAVNTAEAMAGSGVEFVADDKKGSFSGRG